MTPFFEYIAQQRENASANLSALDAYPIYHATRETGGHTVRDFEREAQLRECWVSAIRIYDAALNRYSAERQPCE